MTITQYRQFSHKIYFWLLILLAVSIPFSPFLVTLSQILLIINWLIEGNFRQKWYKLKHRKSIVVFLSFYFLCIIGLLWTEDFTHAADELRIKLPLLILPLIIGTSDDLDTYEVKILLNFFVGAVFMATLLSMAVLLGIYKIPITDVRQISLFISHIRFSLLIVVAILSVLHWIKTSEKLFTKKQFFLLLLILWFVFFLFVLKALTGVVILGITLFLLIFIFVNRIENQLLKISLIVLLYAIPFFSFITIIKVYNSYYKSSHELKSELPKFTTQGNLYFHDTLSHERENGNKVWLYVCEKELRNEWNKRSKFLYDSLDKKGQPIRLTLIRYMTSLNLPKDSFGITQLSGKDIVNIEKGMTNIIFTKKFSIIPRIYEVIWEIDQYLKSGSVDNRSLVQRLVYYKIAIDIIKKYPILGVGTGDLNKSYLEYYQTVDTGLSPERWWQTHNQYLRAFATFGIIGFITLLIAFILPPFFERKWGSYYFVMVFTIIMLSFINEDTLETQAGATFTAFFYSLFLWGASRKLK